MSDKWNTNRLGYGYIVDSREPAIYSQHAAEDAERECSRSLWQAVASVDHPTVVEIRREQRPTWHLGESATEHSIDIRLTPVQTHRIVMPVIDPIVEARVVTKPAPTLGERLRGWWAEMTSPVVYDGPRG